MYAVIKTGGKQYRVMQGETLRVEKLEADVETVAHAADRFFNGFGLLRDGRHPIAKLDGIEGLIGALQEARRAPPQPTLPLP